MWMITLSAAGSGSRALSHDDSGEVHVPHPLMGWALTWLSDCRRTECKVHKFKHILFRKDKYYYENSTRGNRISPNLCSLITPV